ncbi:hypothetical protein, partial [Flavobacterium sp. ACAM 123]|uniref:hypothetical protein n=1 Tax=Flavobacterium sp. ACAM 123 TaxID=1189620 RepID=UPI0005594611
MHRAKHAKFLERLVREDKENEDLHLQKNFKFFLRERKEVTIFAPASRNMFNMFIETKKQEEHVPRHIELTAVLGEILRQKNK